MPLSQQWTCYHHNNGNGIWCNHRTITDYAKEYSVFFNPQSGVTLLQLAQVMEQYVISIVTAVEYFFTVQHFIIRGTLYDKGIAGNYLANQVLANQEKFTVQADARGKIKCAIL